MLRLLGQWLILLFSASLCLYGATGKVNQKAYNVLLITVDTLRYDHLSIYSDKYLKTPNIDRLAAQSFIFERAFSHNPVTLPAHINILTGTTPCFHGVSDNSGFRLDERFLTLGEHLKAQGYRTSAFIGAFPLDSRFGLNQGFDVYDDNYGTHNDMALFFVERPAEKVIAPAMQWIAKQSGKWFSWIHLFDAHQPYLPPAPYDKLYGHDLYSGEVAHVDNSLKVLFDFLAAKGYLENTVVIITGDHGEALGEKGEETHTYFAYNNTIHIPLIIYVPGARSQRVRENVCHADIFPTLCDLLAINTPNHIQGQSLLPIIAGQARKKAQIYFESLTPYLNRGWAPLRGFVRGDIKFIDLPIVEVYNIKDDPDENHNITTQTNVTQLKRDLVKLKLDLQGKNVPTRSQKIDSETVKKLQSLGYLSRGTVSAPKVFTAADDLKTLLPMQNRMLAAVANVQQGKSRLALTQLRAIAQESPGFILVYRHMATIYSDNGQYTEAVDILETGLKKNPDNIELISKLGIALVELGKLEKAFALLDLAIEKESFNPENYNYLGVAYYKKGDFSAALSYYQKALELDKNYASVYNNIGSLHLATFLKGKDESEYQLALQNFTRALEIDPRLFAAYNGRGAAYRFKNKIPQAIHDWQKAIDINPAFIDAYFNLGIAYLGLGDRPSALKYLQLCKDRCYTKLPARERSRLERLLAEAQK